MGLLDLFQLGRGGLADLLQNSALNQNLNAGLGSDVAAYGQPPNTMASPAPQIAPPSLAPTPQAYQAPQALPQSPDFGDRLSAGFQSWAHTPVGSPFAGLANGLQGFASGQRTDPDGIAQLNQQRSDTLTSRVLRARGASDDEVQAAIANPSMMKLLFAQYIRSGGTGPQASRTGGAAASPAVQPGGGPMSSPRLPTQGSNPQASGTSAALSSDGVSTSLGRARAAIMANPAIRGAVIQRLRDYGIDPAGL